jgi:lipopolysaccharide biosynthesis glycosyltransferase
MLPALLPTKEKVLYLDCDILINGDIFELYNQSFDGTSLVAIQDRSDHYSSAFIETYGIKNIAYCFNSGIMLLNLQKMREIQAIDKMMASGCNNNLLQLCMDQDLFNLAFTNDRKEVSATRNAHQYFFVRSRNQFDNIDDKEFEEVRKSPKIIHFT